VRIWDLEHGAVVQKLEGHGTSVTVARPLGEGHLVSGGLDKKLRVWHLGTGTLELEFDSGGVPLGAAAWEDGRGFATASDDGSVRVW
jgi:WD40 repeat protein